MNSNFPGETGLDSLGEILNCTGSNSVECLIYRRGTIFRSRLPGMLVKNTCILRGMLSSAGGYPASLSLKIALLGESVLTCWLTLWGIEISGYVLQLNLLWYLGG